MISTATKPFAEKIDDTVFPAVIRFSANTSTDELVEFFTANKPAISELLSRKGAVLFSGVSITDREVFEDCIKRMGDDFINYVDGNSPRTKLSDVVYTSTEFDPARSITMHNELSYSATWPSKIFFCCIKASATGGETPLADGRLALQKMDQQVVDKIRKEGVIYYRNLHGGEGFGPSWQDTFETTDRHEVEAFCRKAQMEFEWKDNGSLRLVQRRRGIIGHPQTGEEVWFNQADQFHPFHLGSEMHDIMLDMYGSVDELPTYVTYGDGTPIPNEVVAAVQEVFDEISVARPWEEGDLILVDNVLVSHGRKPFTGERKILVAMMQ